MTTTNGDGKRSGTATPARRASATQAFGYTVNEEVRSRHPFLDATRADHLPDHHVPTFSSNLIRRASSFFGPSRDASRAPSPSQESPPNSASQHVTRPLVDTPGSTASSRNGSGLSALTFKNPWPSFRQPTLLDIWRDLHWGLPHSYKDAMKRSKGKLPEETWDDVEIQTPDFSIPASLKEGKSAQAVWLGHATVLLRLPGISKDPEQPFTVLFDPMFSSRCSPSQLAGPLRFTPAPCKAEDLPHVDVICISHNHYDHLDETSIKTLLSRQGSDLHICVPLGVREWMASIGFEEDRISELDWWDEATFSDLGDSQGPAVRIVCTPAQHGSGRGLGDQASALWAGWLVQTLEKNQKGTDNDDRRPTFSAFFAGDTGLRFVRGSSSHRGRYPVCPAFAEVTQKFGAPNLLMLPISVGSSLSYIRSFDPFPRGYSPFPRIGPSLTSSIHMSAADAADCHCIMRNVKSPDNTISLAIHFGTFVADDTQVRSDVRALKHACDEQGINFIRAHQGDLSEVGTGTTHGRFVVSHQGESVVIPLPE